MMVMLIVNGYLDPDLLKDEKAHEQEIVEALYRGLRGSPCKLLAASIVDGVVQPAPRTSPAPTTNIRTGASRWPTARAMSCRWRSCSPTRLLSLAKVMQGR